ncbi:MAG: helical backbone metal receptor [Planctomycetia bacterium]|nr:helical backbone metal receptor [Planctomycetia bacterium]
MEQGADAEKEEVPERVVSLSPALTEMVYALGQENRLVGVTNHCKYPQEAQNKTIIGTVFSPNLEKIGILKPDRILMNVQYPELSASFARFGWRAEELPDQSVEDVFSAIERLGEVFQVPECARSVTENLKMRLDTLRKRTENRPKLRVLVVISRNYDAQTLEEVYIVGQDALCEPLLKVAGGENAYMGSSPFPKVTPEGLLHMAPEVILEVVPDRFLPESLEDMANSEKVDKKESEVLNRAWETLPTLPAVRDRKIFRIRESDAALIPGPSMILWAEKVAEILEKAYNNTKNLENTENLKK